MSVEFTARGVVLGKLWGGGAGYYPARKYRNASLSKLKAEVSKDFKSGGLDSGMGFEKLMGAIMYITKHESKNINGKGWHNDDDLPEWFLGKLSDEQVEEATNFYMNNY